MITSDEVLSERERPQSVVFVGGGVIALEFGHVYARAGSKVTILEVLPRLLPALDADAVEEVRKESERIGIALHTGVKVKRVEKAGNRLRTVFEQDGKERTVESDRVVNGAGRIANVEDLDLDAGNVAHEGFKLAVDDYLRSKTNPSVYVCGDVTASPQLSPSPPMRDGWSAATSSRAPSTSPITRRCHHRSTPCRRSPPSASPRPKPRNRG